MRYKRKGYSSESVKKVHNHVVDAEIPNCMRFTPGWFPLFSIFMIKSSRISAVNEGFWQEIKGTQGRKQQRRKAAKVLETTSLEAEGISIHPCKYWFLSLLLFPSMLQNKPRSPTTTKHLTMPLSGTGPAVSWVGFIKVAHQSHGVIHSLLTTVSSDFCILLYTNPSLQKGFSIKVKLWHRRGLFSSGLHKSSRVRHI